MKSVYSIDTKMKRLTFSTFSLAVALLLLVTVQARASVTLSTANFPDANFRAALTAATGVAEGGSINEGALTTLDVSSQGITNLTGLELLTGLTYLDISDNNTLTTGADIRNLTALKTLKAKNSNIRTLAATSATSSNVGYAGLILGSSNQNITYLDLSYNAHFYTSGNLQYLTKLETLLLNNCTYYDYWGKDPGLSMTSLKHVDVSHCPAMDRIFLRGATQLKHLNAEGTGVTGFSVNASTTQTTTGYIVLANNCPLEYLNLANCSSLTSFQAIKTAYNVTSLDTLILTNDTRLGWSNAGIEAQTGLSYLDVTHCDISTAGPNYIPDFSNLTALETLLYGENPAVTYLDLSGNTVLKELDLHGDTGLAMLTMAGCSLPRNGLTINSTGCTALASLNLNNNGYASVNSAMTDALQWGMNGIRFLYLENSSGMGGGPLALSESDCAGLHGLDLGNNGFTSFTAPSLPETLTALMLGNNPSMTRLEMHNNPGITTMTASATMSEGSGLYLLGCSSLTYMDISGTAEQPNYFTRIGNNGSLYGVPIDTLKASHNKFYTFRNLTQVPGNIYEYWRSTPNGTNPYEYYLTTNGNLEDTYRYKSYWPTMAAMPDSASLEQLSNLRYLDLSYCQLKDSVYLHKNPELRYLDVSHNRTINRSFTTQNKGKGFREWRQAGHNTLDYPDYKKYMWLATNTDDREYFTNDCNDTTGLYILDLLDNNKLEYLDISYTGIEQTAMTHCHVANARYIWIQDLPELKYFYADYNGMRSMGIGTRYGKKIPQGDIQTAGLKSLERLSVIGMRGADDRTMMGSINFRENSVCTRLHYINLSYSRFDSIGVYASQVDTLIIQGNPLHYVNVQKVNDIVYLDASKCAFKQRGYDVETGNIYYPDVNRYKNGARVGGTYNGAETTELSGLRGVHAYGRPYLTTVLLDNCNALTDVYCHHDPMLPKIHGFENLAYNKNDDAQYGFPTVDADSLRLVWVNDNAVFNELNLTKNINLKYLHAYNDKALGDALGTGGMSLNENTSLISAWVSNSNLQAFSNAATTHLDTLKIWQNPQLDYLDVTANTGLKWFDLRNCMIRDLDVSQNTALTYFDCCNMDSITAQWTAFDNYGFTMPRQVPTSMSEPGKNSIADLHFGSQNLQVVRADNNDLYCMDGLNDNPSLHTLTYSYNHINGIDLSGCPAIEEYNCYHNVRGLIPGELSVWKGKDEDGQIVDCNMYYLQLEEDAGDALLSTYDTYLGHKCGHDSIEAASSSNRYMRQLEADGFDPTKVIAFTVNSSGPYVGTRGREPGNAPRRATVVYGPETVPDPSTIYGTVAIIKWIDPVRNYVEYLYDDGRPASSTQRDGGGSAFGLAWGPPGGATYVDEYMSDGMGALEVVSERYYDANGIEHSEPVDGLNIIVRQMSDGSTQTTKVIK